MMQNNGILLEIPRKLTFDNAPKWEVLNSLL